MTYDATIAIAQLSLQDDPQNLDGLREAYPALGFLFDDLEQSKELVNHLMIDCAIAREEGGEAMLELVHSLELRVSDLSAGIRNLHECAHELARMSDDDARYDIVSVADSIVKALDV